MNGRGTPKTLIADRIDFPVSDLWRNHYASQGLTYWSGRHSRVIRKKGYGTVVIRIGLDGSVSLEIIADESGTEEQLRARLGAARSALELLQAAMVGDQ